MNDGHTIKYASSVDGVFFLAKKEREIIVMKFKVTTNIKPNMFGRINGSVTLAGNEGDCPYNVEWLIDEIMALWYDDIKEPNNLIEKRKYITEELSKLNYNRGYSITDKNGRLAILVLRVADNTTFSDIMEEALDGI